jgi:hypothetical protein
VRFKVSLLAPLARARCPIYRPCFLELEPRTLLSFLPPVNYGGIASPLTAVVADFDGDGNPDLAATSAFGAVGVWLGNGDGTFRSPRFYAVGSGAGALAVGDFNGDGIPSLAVGVGPDSAHGMVKILLGNGDGTFRDGPMILDTGGLAVFGLAVADFNGQGHDDLAATVGYPSSSLHIYMGLGHGLFYDGGTYACGDSANGIAVGDFNADGIPDLAISNGAQVSVGGVTVMLGNGDGSFQSPQFYQLGNYQAYGTEAVAVGNLSGNGILDIVAAYTDNYFQHNQEGKVYVLHGLGDGTFQVPADSYNVGYFATDAVIGDFSRNGILDVAVVDEERLDAPSSRVSLLLGNGDGTFQIPEEYDTGQYTLKLAIGDFNSDDFPDLALSNYNSNSLGVMINAADWDQGRPAAPSPVHQSVRHTADRRLQPDRLMAQLTLGASDVDLRFALGATNFATGTLAPGPLTVDDGQVSDANSPAAPIVPERHPLDSAFTWWGDLGLDALALDLLK